MLDKDVTKPKKGRDTIPKEEKVEKRIEVIHSIISKNTRSKEKIKLNNIAFSFIYR